MNDEHITVAPSCGNVYEDLGLPNAEEMLVKAQLALSITKIIKSRGLNQIKAAQIIGLPQPRLSDMLNGKFRGISEAKMLECITRLGRDIQIVINPAARPEDSPGHIEVCMG
jgi:predicted XRE-type DNA-binding protein